MPYRSCLLSPLPSLLLLSHLLFAPFVYSQSSPNATATTTCPTSTGFSNYLIRAPTPASPTLAPKNSFLFSNILFYYTDLNTRLSESSFSQFCLDQCIGYVPDPAATVLPTDALAPFFVTNRTGPCRSFTVDMGKPFPPNPNDTRTRWYCEGFGEYFKSDLSDFEEVDAEGSFMYGLAVNRGCDKGDGYRMF